MSKAQSNGAKARVDSHSSAPAFRLDPKNARKHNTRNKKMLRDSLAEVGAFRSIAVDAEGIVRAGNATYEQALALGYKIKPVEAAADELVAVVRKDLSGKKAERAALLDNRASDTSTWDAEYMHALAGSDPDLLEGMFTGDELLEFEALAWDQADAADGQKYGGMRDEKERAKFVELVIAVDAHEGIERAIAKARDLLGCNRGEALAHICDSFLVLA